jgi:hypothetical protein
LTKDLYISAYILIIYLCCVLGNEQPKVRRRAKGNEICERTSDTYFRKPIHIEKFLQEMLLLRFALGIVKA